MGVAQMIKVGDTVHGIIGAVAGTSDQDWYKIDNTTAGRMVRVTLAARAGGDYHTFAQVIQATGVDSHAVVRGGTDPKSGTREVYLPRVGTYFVQIGDLRNLGAATVGGASSTYELKLESATVTPESKTLPATGSGLSVPADGKLLVWEVTVPSGNNRLKVETTAQRLIPASNVDTLVWLMSSGPPVAFNDYHDDISAGAGNTDSLIQTALGSGGKFLIVFDHVDVEGAVRTYNVTVENLGP